MFDRVVDPSLTEVSSAVVPLVHAMECTDHSSSMPVRSSETVYPLPWRTLVCSKSSPSPRSSVRARSSITQRDGKVLP